MRYVPLALALALLCLFSGCNGLAPVIGGDGEMPPVTPAEIPRDMYGGTVAPGLTEHRVVNASALLDAHRDVLANRSVTVETHTVHERGDEIRTNRTATFRHAADRERVEVTIEYHADRDRHRTRVWSNGSTIVFREGRGDRTFDRVEERRGGWFDAEIHQDQLRHALDRATAVSVRALDADGEYDTFEVSVIGHGEDYPVEFSTTFVVDERGFVSRFTETRRESGERPGRRTTTTRYVRVGETEVGRPAWVDDALDRITGREYVTPGVTTERVVYPGKLRQAHREAIRNASVTREYERVHRGENGTLLDRRVETVWTDVDRRHYYRVEEHRGGNGTRRVERWSNETIAYRRTGGGEPRYDRFDATELYASAPTFDPSLTFAEETAVTALGDGRYRVVATGVPTNGYRYDPKRDREIRDVRVEFIVHEDGFVEEYVRSSTRVEEGRTVRHRETYRYTDRGTTEVPRPAWLDQAVNETDGRAVVDD